MKKKILFLVLISIIAFAGIVSAEDTLPNEQGVYYLPDGLTDVRSVNFLNSQILLTSKSDQGDVVMSVYQMGQSHLNGYHLFEATDVDKITSGNLPNQQGIYYLPDGLTDVRGVDINNSEVIITSKADSGDVVMTIYQLGTSNLNSYAHFQATDINKIIDGSLGNEQGLYYIPDNLTDVRNLQIINSEIIITARSYSGDVFIIFYEFGNSTPTSVAYFQPTPINDITSGNLPNEQGTYYLPDTFTDVRAVEITSSEIALTSRTDAGDIVMTFYDHGNSAVAALAHFKPINPDQLYTGSLSNEQGVYYLPDGLTDIRDVKIENSEVILTSRSDSGEVFMVVYEFGKSEPTSFAYFQATDPEKCFKN